MRPPAPVKASTRTEARPDPKWLYTCRSWFSATDIGTNDTDLSVPTISVEDPHWYQCGSGSSFFLSPLDPDLRSQTNANPCGSGSWSDFKVTKSRIFTRKTYFNFHAPGSGSAFQIRIRIPIQDSQINADPDLQTACNVSAYFCLTLPV